MQTDGMIVIGTTIDDREFYKKIREFEKVKDYSIEINPEFDVKKLQEEIIKANAELQKYKGLEVLSEDDLSQVQMLLDYIDAANQKITELGGQQIIIKGLNDTEASLEQIEESAKKIDLSNIEKQIGNIGKSIQKVTKRIAKMAVAVFGIRSAFMFVRNAINTISGNDEQLKADIDYMKNALAYTLEPLVRGIVNLAKQLMFYVGYIVKAWTGKNIFANANKSLAGANKEAKELSKTMSGFDEMNVVSSSSSSSSGGATPSFDLSSQENLEPPKWLQWIADHKEEITAGLLGIAGALGAVKFGFLDLEKMGKSEFFTKLAGIALIISGIIYAIQELLKYINDPSWSNFGGIISGIGIALAGVALIFTSWPLAIAAAIVTVLGILAKFWDKTEVFLENLKEKIFEIGDNIMNWINDKLEVFGVIINTVIGTIIGTITSTIDLIKSLLGGVFNFLRSILDSIIMVFKGDFKGALSTILKGIGNLFIDVINVIISALNLITSPIRALIVAVGKVVGKNWTMENIQIPKIPRLAKGGIINNPGRGVAIGGERGAEGVIPLTDSQQMDLLGEAIARHMVVNLTNITQMNGRVLSRELKKLQNDINFAAMG